MLYLVLVSLSWVTELTDQGTPEVGRGCSRGSSNSSSSSSSCGLHVKIVAVAVTAIAVTVVVIVRNIRR